MERLRGDRGAAHPMQGHLSQERRYASPSLRGQQGPDRRQQIAHRGIQANAPGRIALRARFSAIRPDPSIYERYREWDIELFFKWIKQHLRIKQFYGTSENAVKTQIWIAVSVYVLVAIVKKQLKIETSLYTSLQILSVSLFEKMPLYQALAVEESKGDTWQVTNQLELFVF
jgi:IS4 transposase